MKLVQSRKENVTRRDRVRYELTLSAAFVKCLDMNKNFAALPNTERDLRRQAIIYIPYFRVTRK